MHMLLNTLSRDQKKRLYPSIISLAFVACWSLLSSVSMLANPSDSLTNIGPNEMSDMRMGIYIDNISDIDYSNHTYNVVFYVWNNTRDEFVNLLDELDVLNTLKKEILYDERDSVWVDQHCYYSHMIKLHCTILNELNLTQFPFDQNELNLNMELLSHLSGQRKVLLDHQNSRLSPDFIKDWTVDTTELTISSNGWNSNFGDFGEVDILHNQDPFKTLPQDHLPKFDTINAVVHLTRDSWGIFYKLFFVLFLSMIMACSSIFLPNDKSEEKISIIVGSLFAAIGNKYITDSLIPIVDSFGLSDIIHLLTIFGLLILVFYAIYEQRRRLEDSLKKDIVMFAIILVAYFSLVTLFTYNFYQAA